MFILLFFLICAVILLIFVIMFSKELRQSLEGGEFFSAIVKFFEKMVSPK